MLPLGIHWFLTLVKVASVGGLLSVKRRPRVARLTTAMLTVYFVLAVGAHIRVRDTVVNTLPATGFLTTYAALTATGPTVARVAGDTTAS